MRPSYLHRRHGEQAELQMLTPLIDVVFLLMIFFLWTASFQIVEEVLPSQLSLETAPGATATETPPPEADFDDVVVRIEKAEDVVLWQVNEAQAASLAEVQVRLNRIAGVKRDAPVIVDADGDVPLGDVIDVYDLARLAGFEQVQFAASVDGG